MDLAAFFDQLARRYPQFGKNIDVNLGKREKNAAGAFRFEGLRL